LNASTIRTSRRVQLVFVVLLTTCLGMVAFWIMDHSDYSTEMTETVLELYEGEAELADRLVTEYGLDPVEVADLMEDVELGQDGATVSPLKRRSLELDLASRSRRYMWEGGFFVLVLVATLGMITAVLRQRTELLRRQQNFLAAVSHELKSPLASIKLAAETLILRELDPAGQRRIADRMVQSIERLDTLVSNLLDAARLDEGHLQLNPERLVLREVVERALGPVAHMDEFDGVGLDLDVPGDLCIRADANAARSVVSNLANNAYKSAKAAGGGTVRIAAAADGKRVRLEVIDDGLGFDPAIAEELFGKFYRAGDEMRRRTKGSGLGLHLVRRFMALDGGAVRAASDGEGQGATFTVWWRTPGAPEGAPEGPQGSQGNGAMRP